MYLSIPNQKPRSHRLSSSTCTARRARRTEAMPECTNAVYRPSLPPHLADPSDRSLPCVKTRAPTLEEMTARISLQK